MTEPVATAGHRWPPTRRTALVAGAAVALAVAVGLAVAGARDPGPLTSSPTTSTDAPAPTAGPSDAADDAAEGATPDPGTAPDDGELGPGEGDVAAGETPGPLIDDEVIPDAPADLAPLPAVPELPPVPLDAPADFGTDVAARLTEVVRVDGQGQGRGEDSGPAMAVTVEMTNSGSQPLDLSFVSVTLTDAAGNPGQVLLGDPRSDPLTGPLDPAGTTTGTYVLRLPADDAVDVTVTVSYGAEAPTAVFSGPVPAGPAG